jgi:cobalt-zinc-cadmium resistance protein CzcA
MFEKIINYSVRNKLLVSLFIAALIVGGVYSFKELPIDSVPDITNNQVQVITNAPTLAAQEVEQFITYPLELSLRNIPGTIEIRSISRFSISVITVVFKDNVNTYLARQLVDEKIKSAGEQIPKDFGKPQMAPITTGLGEIYQYIIQPKKGFENKYDLMQLRTYQDWIVKRQLSGTEGVVEVSSFGGYEKQYEVSVNPEKLNSQSITIADIFKALQDNNENTGAAYIEKDHSAYFIRGEGISHSVKDIENIVVKTVNGLPVLIRDVAKVGFGHSTRYGAMTHNNTGEAVGGIVLMLKGENSAKVIGKVKERIAQIQKSLPEGLEIKAFIDRTRLIDNTFHTVSRNLIEGALIVIFVLILLVGNLRAGLIIASVIPLSMLFAIILMNIFGVSANLMSLGAVDFGLIVDGAVVIVEGVLHYLHNGYKNKELSKEEMNDNVTAAASGIMKSAAFGIIIILIVYVPILSLVGIEGKMFRPMAQTVGFALIGALILSLTYVPMMSAFALSRKISDTPGFSDKIIMRMQKVQQPVLKFALRRKFLIVLVSLGFLALSVIVFLNLGGEFIPTIDEGDFAVECRLAQGSSLTQTIETQQKAAAILLKKFPEVKEVVGKLGTAEVATDPMPLEDGDIIVILKEKSEWTSADSRNELASKMKEELSIIPGASFEFSQPIQMRFNELMTGVRSDVAIKIYGEDLSILHDKANEAASLIHGINGVADLKVEYITGLPQIVVAYDRGKVARYGLNIHTLNETVRAAMAGEEAGIIYEGEKRFQLVVRFEQEFRVDIESLRNLYVKLPEGNQIPLKEVADIDFKSAPSQISRDDTKRRIVIGINVRNRDVESLVKEIQGKLDSGLKLPPGYTISYGGQFQNLQEAKSRLSIAVPIAMLLILMLLFLAFRSIKESVLIFTAIPFAAIGGVFALWLRDMPFSISAGIGFIALFGVAVLNGIVLIAYFNKMEKEGIEDIEQRVLEGTKVRLRPVIMTAAVASLGFLPMAISTSAGAEVQRPLATVVIGGLITSTLLTLIVLPVLYSIFTKRKAKGANPNSGILALIGLFIIGASLHSKAQQAKSLPAGKPGIPISLGQAIDTALKNNPSIKAASFRVEQQNQLRKTAFDLPKTNFYRNNEADIYYGMSQEFSLPNVYIRQSHLQNANMRLSEKERQIKQAELIRQVRTVYFNLSNSNARLRLYNKLDSIYGGFAKAANLRYKTGETANLEKLIASGKAQQMKLSLQQVQADIAIEEKQLQLLLNTSMPVTVSENESSRLSEPKLNKGDSFAASPNLAYLQQSIQVAKTQQSLEKAKLLPDFSLGYAQQQLRSGGIDQAYYAGIHVPLWFRPQQGRIQAAGSQIKIAESEYQNNLLSYKSALNNYTQEYLKYNNVLLYYDLEGLALSDEILKSTDKSYQAGEIGYVEHIQNLEQAVNIHLSYLESLNQYNQALISIYFIQGQ